MITKHIKYKKNKLHIEGMDAEKLAEKYGTPLYCYAATHIKENAEAYKKAFAKVMPKNRFTVCYAVKANSNQSLLTLIRKTGAGADVVSGGELQRALTAGIAPQKIVYSGVGKSEKELTAAIKLDLLQINIESEVELERISRIAQKLRKTARIALRVNPDVDAKTHHKISTGKKEDKFGIDIGDALRIYNRAKKMPAIAATGVAVHIGSQILHIAPYKRAYQRVAKLVKDLRNNGHAITTVDIGGGIGIRQHEKDMPINLDAYAKMVRDVLGALDVHIVMEPGRSIVGEAGVVLSRVVSVKKGHHKTFVIIDAAMNDLVRPAMYDAYHAIIPAKKSARRRMTCDIVGPVCETSDVFLKGEKFPAMQAGDLVAITCAGAYGTVMSSTYNTRPRANEVLVKGTKSALIRKEETVRSLIAADIVPKWVA